MITFNNQRDPKKKKKRKRKRKRKQQQQQQQFKKENKITLTQSKVLNNIKNINLK